MATESQQQKCYSYKNSFKFHSHPKVYNTIKYRINLNNLKTAMCLGPAPQPPTEKAAFYQTFLLVLIFCQLAILILDFIAKSWIAGFFGILMLFVLFLARRQMNHQTLMIFMFFSMYFAIMFMVEFLTPVQNGVDFTSYNGYDMFQYIIFVVSFVYYLFCSIILFFPYREFKSISFSQNPALAAYFNSQQNQEQVQEGRKKPENQEQEADYNVDYGDFGYEQRKKNNQKGQFQVFQGKGVKIG